MQIYQSSKLGKLDKVLFSKKEENKRERN